MSQIPKDPSDLFPSGETIVNPMMFATEDLVKTPLLTDEAVSNKQRVGMRLATWQMPADGPTVQFQRFGAQNSRGYDRAVGAMAATTGMERMDTFPNSQYVMQITEPSGDATFLETQGTASKRRIVIHQLRRDSTSMKMQVTDSAIEGDWYDVPVTLKPGSTVLFGWVDDKYLQTEKGRTGVNLLVDQYVESRAAIEAKADQPRRIGRFTFRHGHRKVGN